MKDKILFWIDPDFLQFGIAKFLQKKIEADFYAIVDLNHHLEKSFKTQIRKQNRRKKTVRKKTVYPSIVVRVIFFLKKEIKKNTPL